MCEHERPRHYAILVRHAKRMVCWDKPEDQHQMAGWENQRPDPKSNFSKEGFDLTHALAGRLCDELLTDRIAVKKIIHGEHLVAKQTAEVYKSVFEEREINKTVLGAVARVEVQECRALSPGFYSDKDLETIKIDLERQRVDDSNRQLPANLAYVLVGHQPELTTIARRWLGRALPVQTLPIGGSESACLALGDAPRLLWLITKKSDDLMSELKDKIKSKYDVAKFFLGAFVVNTGLILNAGVWDTIGASSGSPWIDKVLVIAAVVAALVALMFTAATLFSYDALLMPSSLWSEKSEPANNLTHALGRPPGWSVSRPPSQAHVVLFYEMVHVWTAFFMPAVIAAFASVGLLVLALARQGTSVLVRDPLSLAVALVIAAFLLPWAFYQSRQPKLGSED